jgi:hypothetical protein
MQKTFFENPAPGLRYPGMVSFLVYESSLPVKYQILNELIGQLELAWKPWSFIFIIT